MNLKRLLIGLCVATLILTAVPVHAQDIDCNALDFANLTTLLTQAQAKASSGDKDGALALAAQVQAALAQMQEQCQTAAPSEVVLSETYEDKAFSFKYPADFKISEDTRSLLNSAPGFSNVALINDQAILDALNANKQIPSGTQLIAVGAGPAASVARAIGGFSSSVNYDTITAQALLKQVITTAPANVMTFAEVQTLTLNDHPAAIAFFATNAQDKTPLADAYILIIQLSKESMGVVIGFTAPDEGSQLEPIIKAMAESVALK